MVHTSPPAGPRALVIGEALVDVVHRAGAAPDAAAVVDEHPGGSPANVALTLGRLGRPADLLTWLGTDPRGVAVAAWLEESGVALAPGSTGAARTSVATARLGTGGAATYEFDLTWELPADAGVPDGTVVAHTGSIAAVLEPGAGAVRRLLDAARPNATITYDPNVRPSLMGTPDVVRPLVEDLVRGADVVKVSDEDLLWLYPDVAPAEVAERWQTTGPALVVVTYGGEGAVACCASGRTQVAAPEVTVADTVGAGDSFMGALLHGLWSADLLGGNRRDALRAISPDVLAGVLDQCVRVAALTVSRSGANPPRLSELG